MRGFATATSESDSGTIAGVTNPPISYMERVSTHPHNWLVHRIIVDVLQDAAATYARGRLANIGSADKPWPPIFCPYVTEHVGVDHVDSLHDAKQVDVLADAYDTTLDPESIDCTIVTTQKTFTWIYLLIIRKPLKNDIALR